MLLRYIVFYCESGCDTSEPHVSYISRACSSLVCQSYYIPNRFSLKIRGLVVVLTVRKVHWAGRASNQPSGLLLSARVPTSRNVYRGDFRFCRIVLYDAAFFYVQKTLADRAGLRTLKSDANRAGSSIYFLKIHRFHASFFAFCRVLRASASLLCPLLGNSFKNFRTIVG